MLRFKVKSRRNPITKAIAYYPTLTSPVPIGINEVSRRIAVQSTLTRHDILACLSALEEQMIQLLSEGRSIRLGDVGSFRVTIHSIGATSELEFGVSNITDVRVRFVASSEMMRRLKPTSGEVTFMNVMPPKAPDGGGGSGPSLGA